MPAKKKGGHSDDETESSIKPLPKNFDKFIPWVCNQWCASTAVVVTRMLQEDYHRSISSMISKKRTPKPSLKGSMELSSSLSLESSVKGLNMIFNEYFVPIKAYYNTKNQLVEISIIGCSKISRIVIQAISLSIPYQKALNRLTIQKGGLDCELIYDICKLFPHSNITDICFDDSYVPEGNYYILLEQISQLKYLSLNRCRINDEVCMKIAINLKRVPAANSLKILELGTNNITDSGARSLAEMLKLNRSLLHLNLSGNKITDGGFIAILNTLKEFQLTSAEYADTHRRTLIYLQNRMAVYDRCLKELEGRFNEVDSSAVAALDKFAQSNTAKQKRKKSKRSTVQQENIKHQAEIMARGIVGEFRDVFGPGQVERREGVYYARGNLTLCSLNVAYNGLAFPSIQQLYKVVLYQGNLKKKAPETGLMRVTLDGNYMPKTCMELDVINVCLTRVITNRVPVSRKTRTSSTMRNLMAKRGTIH